MLNTYIKNRGITKTIVHNNNDNYINEVAWDADYDGDIANVSMATNSNGKHQQFDLKLDNEDLANILNVSGVNIPIDKRLQMDFKEPANIPEQYFIELPIPKLEPRQPTSLEFTPQTSASLEDLLTRNISSPKTNEELIVPLTIDRKTKYTLTPRRRHRRQKTHVTHRVYKKPKSRKLVKSKTRSKSSKSSSRRKSTPVLELL
jgi:hypothetical protein